MFLNVDAFPDYTLVHVPTLDRGTDVGGKPDQRVFLISCNEMLTLPEDGLPKHSGWAASGG